jgi:hypothetical protein
MDAHARGALMLVRFTAVALLCASIAELSLYFVISQHNNTPMQILPCVLKSIPALLGIVLLIKSKSVADWISAKLEE